LINKNLYIWACDLSSYTGEGALADLFIKKKLTKNNNIHIINKIENINIKNNTFYGKYIAPFVGIYYCWKYYLSKKKVCYLNYLPLWNFLIFILLPPNTMLGPITGGSKYKKELSINYLIRSFIFPKLYKVSDIIIRSRDYKIIFSTSLLKKYLNKKLIQKSQFDFFIKGIEKKTKVNCIRKFDFIIYFKNHKNKSKLYPINFIKKLVIYKFKVFIVGDNLNINGVSNLGYLNNSKLNKILSQTKFAISSGENVASFFSIECANNGVMIITNNDIKKINPNFKKFLIYLNTNNFISKEKITSLIKNYKD
jgi:hypothetical protein